MLKWQQQAKQSQTVLLTIVWLTTVDFCSRESIFELRGTFLNLVYEHFIKWIAIFMTIFDFNTHQKIVYNLLNIFQRKSYLKYPCRADVKWIRFFDKTPSGFCLWVISEYCTFWPITKLYSLNVFACLNGNDEAKH